MQNIFQHTNVKNIYLVLIKQTYLGLNPKGFGQRAAVFLADDGKITIFQ